jgi:hypothetical protein
MKKFAFALLTCLFAVSFSFAQVDATHAPSKAPSSSLVTFPNASSTGTTLAKLAKLTGVNTAVLAATTDNTNGQIIGVVVSGAGTTGSATLLQIGAANCVFPSGGVVQNEFVTVSTATAGDCADYGPTLPVDGSEVLGRVISPTNGAAGTYLVLFNLYLFGPGNALVGNGLTVTASTGTLTIGNGLTETFNNTLTFAGTNGTTETFPTTSATIARTDAANTFTGTQTIGALVATTFNGNTLTTGSSTFTGTAAQTYTFPTTSATIARTDAANTFTGHQTIEGTATTGATGSNLLVFATSPTLTTPVLGAAAYSTLAGGNIAPTTGTGAASISLAAGTAPTTPSAGDIWNDSTKKAIVISPTVSSNPLSLGGTLCVFQPQTPITTVTTIQVLNSSTCTVPAGAVNVIGKTLHVKGYFVFSNAADTPVMTVTLKLGTVLMAAPLSAANANSNSSSPVWFEFYATTASTGASGTLEAHGTLIDTVSAATHGVAAAVYSDFLAAASSAVDLTASENVTLSLTSSSGTVTSATLRWGIVEVAN